MVDNNSLTDRFAEYNAQVRERLASYSIPTANRIKALQIQGELISNKITKQLESSTSLHQRIFDQYF